MFLGGAPTADALPSSRSRALLTSVVTKHEARLKALRQRAAVALQDGRANVQAALKALPVLVHETLSAAAHGTTVELDEIVAFCEDGFISACAAASVEEARDIVGGLTSAVRQRQRQLPLSLSSAMETCVAAAEAAVRNATNAANAAADAAAAVIVDGCVAARTALERDAAVALEALGECDHHTHRTVVY